MKKYLFPWAVVCLLFTFQAQAGVPECGNALIDADAQCAIVVAADCDAQCNVDDSLVGLCAADLAAACDAGCTTEISGEQSAEAELFCEATCADGDVVCSRNCQGECSGQCASQCEGAEDADQCLAGCEASCDVECEQRCGNVDIESGCYRHCLECMTATFHVEVNFECQASCQADGFANCTAELQSACEGSCSGEGSMFCDGQLVATGQQIVPCAEALADAGVTVEVEGDVDGVIDIAPDVDWGTSSESEIDDGNDVGAGCSVAPGGRSGPVGGLVGFLGFGLLFAGLGRVRRASRPI